MAANDKWIVATMGEVAEFFGVQPGTVRRDWRRAGMPGSPGRWDLSAIIQWRRARDEARQKYIDSQRRDGTLDDHLLAERLRKLRFANDKKEAALVNVDEVRTLADELAFRIRQRLERIPGECADAFPDSVRTTIVGELQHRIGQIVREVDAARIAGD